jgi:hypothetical protein
MGDKDIDTRTIIRWILNRWIWDRSVIIVTGYGAGEPGFDSQYGQDFSLPHSIHIGTGTQPPIQWVWGLFPPDVKQQGHEADHSLPSSVKVKKTRNCTSTPQNIFMVQCLVS